MTPLFVAYFASWKGEHRGWLVFNDIVPIKEGKDVAWLAAKVAKHMEWPVDTVTILSFQRLETE